MTEITPARYARCPDCGDLSFPQHLLLPCGHDGPPELVPFVEPGEVYSWTRTHGDDGTLLAMADFLGGDLRVTARVEGADAVSIGDPVVVLARDDGSFSLGLPQS